MVIMRNSLEVFGAKRADFFAPLRVLTVWFGQARRFAIHLGSRSSGGWLELRRIRVKTAKH
jgi:hypothetical protein